jgi:hypothetical protein
MNSNVLPQDLTHAYELAATCSRPAPDFGSEGVGMVTLLADKTTFEKHYRISDLVPVVGIRARDNPQTRQG